MISDDRLVDPFTEPQGTAVHELRSPDGTKMTEWPVQGATLVAMSSFVLGMTLNYIRFTTIEVLVAMSMTRWEFRIAPCLAGGNASATSLKMLFMHFANVQ